MILSWGVFEGMIGILSYRLRKLLILINDSFIFLWLLRTDFFFFCLCKHFRQSRFLLSGILIFRLILSQRCLSLLRFDRLGWDTRIWCISIRFWRCALVLIVRWSRFQLRFGCIWRLRCESGWDGFWAHSFLPCLLLGVACVCDLLFSGLLRWLRRVSVQIGHPRWTDFCGNKFAFLVSAPISLVLGTILIGNFKVNDARAVHLGVFC